ncbi:unnamed protein product [Neisseria lactamica Y92-1009]|nr:unnamed protein product [Neisseria lactamica Y92-1009]
MAEAGSKGRAGGKCEQQEGGAAHKFLQIENGVILWVGKGGCKQPGYNLPQIPIF